MYTKVIEIHDAAKTPSPYDLSKLRELNRKGKMKIEMHIQMILVIEFSK